MKIIDTNLLDSVTDLAGKNPRLRMNYNFHENLEDKAQCLLNAMEPGTVMPIHRHRHTPETYILLRGKLKVLLYSDTRELTDSVVLNPLEGKFGVNIPIGQFHSIEVLESGTVIFEVKEGPYTPIGAMDVL